MATKTGKKVKRVSKLRPTNEAVMRMLKKRECSFVIVDGSYTPAVNSAGKLSAVKNDRGYYAYSRNSNYIGMNGNHITNIYLQAESFKRVTINDDLTLRVDEYKMEDVKRRIDEWQEVNGELDYSNRDRAPVEFSIYRHLYSIGSYNRYNQEHILVSDETLNKGEDAIKIAKEYNNSIGETGEVCFGDKMKSSAKIALPYLIERHPENDTGIVCWKLNVTISVKNGVPCIEPEVVAYYEITPGIANSRTYNVRKTGDYESILEDILNIKNSDIYFEGMKMSQNYYMSFCSKVSHFDRESLNDFFEAFPNFTKRTGMDVSFALAGSWGLAEFLAKYLYLIAEFPVVEQLIKMSYWKLVSDIIQSLNVPKYERKEVCAKISSVISSDATSGKNGVKLPSWMSQYMNDHMIGYRELISWASLQATVNFSKENFEKFVKSSEYKLSRLSGRDVINELAKIAVYGYDPHKTLRYAQKQSTTCATTIDSALNNLFDYARMCDVMGIQPDLYPKNIREVHDAMVANFKAYQDAALDGNIAKRRKDALPALTALKKLKIYEDSDYDIIIPESSFDIIDEGQQQHNCVGSYTRRVADGDSLVFFVREKEALDKSYVTVEYRNGQMLQCFYAHNRYVNRESQEALLAMAFCKELHKHEKKKSEAA